MDEKKIQHQRRDHEEKSTQQRAAILGLQYLDTREFEDELDLVKELMTIEDMLGRSSINPVISASRILEESE